MWVAFANAKATHIFSKNISIYAIYFNDLSFNNTLSNNIVSFEQLEPEVGSSIHLAIQMLYLFQQTCWGVFGGNSGIAFSGSL